MRLIIYMITSKHCSMLRVEFIMKGKQAKRTDTARNKSKYIYNCAQQVTIFSRLHLDDKDRTITFTVFLFL